MSSTAFDKSSPGNARPTEKWTADETAAAVGVKAEAQDHLPYSSSEESFTPIHDNTHRRLKPRHIQLIGIGGYESLLIELSPRNGDGAVGR